MELLDGETLAEAIARKRRFRPGEAEPLVRQMAMALSAAHAHGVLHRDFKSSNVLLVPAPDGEQRVVVTDFGVARAVRDGRELLTETGSYVGTPAYMAPEQASGRRLTPAADVYALGVVVYEMFTGALPFRDEGVGSVRSRGRPPDPSARTPGPSRNGGGRPSNGRWPRTWRTAAQRPAAFLHLLSGGRVRTAGDRRRTRRTLVFSVRLPALHGGGRRRGGARPAAARPATPRRSVRRRPPGPRAIRLRRRCGGARSPGSTPATTPARWPSCGR